MKTKEIKKIIPILLLVATLVFFIKSLFDPGLMSTHDAKWHIRRSVEMFTMIKKGYFPVRWGLTLDNNFGVPLFNFIYPLPYYITSAFQFLGIGLITSHKLLILISYLIGPLGVFIYSKTKTSSFNSFLIALIYSLIPYHFLNVFVRGAIGEILAIGLMPWAIFSHQHLKKKGKLSILSPLPLALLLLSHNFLGLLFIPIMVLLIAFTSNNKNIQIINTLFSIGIASFFILPMIFERGLLLSSVTNDFSFVYSDHFVYPKQLLYSKWDFWYSLPGPNDTMSFQLGFASIITILASLIALVKFKKSKKLVIFTILYLFFTFMMVRYSNIFWIYLPILQTMQFPWRFLAFTTLLTPFLLIELSHLYRKNVTKALLVFLLILSIVNTRNYRNPIRNYTDEEFMDIYRLFEFKTATANRAEVVPKWSSIEKYQPDNNGRWPTKSIGIYEGPTSLELINEGEGLIIIKANAENDNAKIIIYKNYFPSWKGVNLTTNENVELYPSEEGSIIFNPKPGLHEYKIFLSKTRLEYFSEILTIITAVMLIAYVYKNSKK